MFGARIHSMREEQLVYPPIDYIKVDSSLSSDSFYFCSVPV